MTFTKEEAKAKKKRVLDFLKKEGFVEEGDTGQLVIHFNDGGITKIVKNNDVLR